jgi:hypothetical protein
MPRARGKANYKVELLIEVVEEKLPQGALGWQEVAALYQFRSQESVLRDYEDVKRHWTEKLCNKFKKPTGDPGDPVRDKILRCQRIHQKILAKSSSVVMGADSGEDEVSGTGSEDEAEDDDVGEEEEDDDYMEDIEIAWATTTAIYTTTIPVAATTATSRTTTPTALVTTATTDSLIQNLASVSASRYDNDVIQDTQQDPDMTQLNSPFRGSGVQESQEELSLRIRREELARHWSTPLVPRIQPGQLPPQNQLTQHQQNYQQYQQYLYQQQLQRTQQSSTATATTTTTTTSAVTTCDPPASTAKKQKKRRSEDVSPTPIPNQKTKNSSSEKRGSIVKSIDTLVKTIATDESDNKQASAASAAAFSQMQMQMQMQQMSFSMQQQMQEMQRFMRRAERKEKKRAKKMRKQKKKKKRKKAAKAKGGEEGGGISSSSSSSSSSSCSSDS